MTTPIRGPSAPMPFSRANASRSATMRCTIASTSARDTAGAILAMAASTRSRGVPPPPPAVRASSVIRSGIASFAARPASTAERRVRISSLLTRSTATPSRASSRQVASSVRAAVVGRTPAATAASNVGSRSENAIWCASASSSPNALTNRSARSVRSSGTAMLSQRSLSISTGNTSVSGYIRAAPGSGRM